MDYLHISLIITLLYTLYGLYRRITNRVCKSKRRLDGKTCLITGGTSGLGLEIAKDFAARGARVIVACPFQDEGNDALRRIVEKSGNDNVVFKLLDLASFKSVREFAADILKAEDRLDVLMNNAGVGAPQKMTEDSMDIIMQVNYLGHFLLTILLLPLLNKSGTPSMPSRIVNTVSITHVLGQFKVNNLQAIKNNVFARFFVYSNSKFCLMLFTREMTKKLARKNVLINDADPGEVGTNIFFSCGNILGYFFKFTFLWLSKNPWEGAQTPIFAAVDEKVKSSGKLYRNCREFSTIKKINDVTSKELWGESVRCVKLSEDEISNCFMYVGK